MKKTDEIEVEDGAAEEIAAEVRVSTIDANFYRDDLNALAAKLNELIEVVNSL